jgi:hypothetical protein
MLQHGQEEAKKLITAVAYQLQTLQARGRRSDKKRDGYRVCTTFMQSEGDVWQESHQELSKSGASPEEDTRDVSGNIVESGRCQAE